MHVCIAIPLFSRILFVHRDPVFLPRYCLFAERFSAELCLFGEILFVCRNIVCLMRYSWQRVCLFAGRLYAEILFVCAEILFAWRYIVRWKRQCLHAYCLFVETLFVCRCRDIVCLQSCYMFTLILLLQECDLFAKIYYCCDKVHFQ